MWTAKEAQAHLSEVMRRARAGDPQVIGFREPCVGVSAKQVNSARPNKHLGRWLIQSAPRGTPIELPPRSSMRDDPFSES
jgi:hypothetical protein